MTNITKHPARFSSPVFDVMAQHVWKGAHVLDPYAGTGGVHQLQDLGCTTIGIEIEQEWAAMNPLTFLGDATKMVFPDEEFDIVFTSPTFGNRMADHHEAKDPCKKCRGEGATQQKQGWLDTCTACSGTGYSKRHTYRHMLGRPLTTGNTGGMQWGDEYRRYHKAAWKECFRVLGHNGLLILHIGDHIRNGERIKVSKWHYKTLRKIGFEPVSIEKVYVKKMKHGANRKKRIPFEYVIVMSKP